MNLSIDKTKAKLAIKSVVTKLECANKFIEKLHNITINPAVSLLLVYPYIEYIIYQSIDIKTNILGTLDQKVISLIYKVLLDKNTCDIGTCPFIISFQNTDSVSNIKLFPETLAQRNMDSPDNIFNKGGCSGLSLYSPKTT